MPGTYLTVQFSDKDSVKSLGAKWDAQERRWFVPEGRVLSVFERWLPQVELTLSATLSPTGAQDVQVARRGKSLSQLLGAVSGAVSRAFPEGEWTVVEVMQASLRRHVYLELAERDSTGSVLAKAGGMIWANVAQRILPQFEKVTGVTLGPGIKLLVHAKPEMQPQFGFRLTIDAIDPSFTLGDLEAKKREIRSLLQQEGIWGNNKALQFPWDFNDVLVVAPPNAAGLGDFDVEATRLQATGLCRFTYVHSRFQGEGAAAEICEQLTLALNDWQHSCSTAPDAVVFIRGGGAVNDLAWLNDYDLAKLICGMKIPVLTGIGHERDSTILDEVANANFDTPSKVIAGIEARIETRAREAKSAFDELVTRTKSFLETNRRATDRAKESVLSDVVRQIHHAKTTGSAAMSDVRLLSVRNLYVAEGQARDRLREVNERSATQVLLAKQKIPMFLRQVQDQVHSHLTALKEEVHWSWTTVLSGSRATARQCIENLATIRAQVNYDARSQITLARAGTEALIREVSGQGPQKTLERGFAIVRDANGEIVTSALRLESEARIGVTFRDGVFFAAVKEKELKE